MPENWGTLERPGRRVILMRELAIGTHTQGELAQKYGVTQQGISDFKDRHRAEIEELREDLTATLSTLWVANRIALLDALQGDAERLENLADGFEGSEDLAASVPGAMNSRRMALDLASKLAGLQREQVDVNVTRVVHEVVGVEPEELT